ncbi:MAG: ribosome-associated translation inhibitor RaiA [Armatimonadetes bacterium]|nr:ribosome-associated translation inhibitor RaiA [Armatimonadota bacterium]MDW8027059.1 ribosome-associated translation inhibitor RaiA [Armatimonadota bacterium]
MARKSEWQLESLPIRFVTHDIQLAGEFQEHAQKSIDSLRKIYPNMQEAEVEVRKERGRFIVEVTLKIARYLLRAQEKAHSLRSAFDKAMDKIDRQLHRHKERLIDRRRHSKPVAALATDLTPVFQIPVSDFTIVRTKKFSVKPMTLDEAIVQMDLLGHDFFVFVNAETGQVNVLYKRKAGGLGLLEPGDEEEATEI